MSLDPIEYDVVELRELARRRGDQYLEDGFLWPEPSEGFPPLDDLADVTHEVRWTGSYDERQKPYLSELPSTPEAGRLVEQWVTQLVETAGFDGAREALAYYEALGWITEGIEAELQDYMLAAGNHPGGSLDRLDRDDHVDSLARVIALAQLGGDDASEVGVDPDSVSPVSDAASESHQTPIPDEVAAAWFGDRDPTDG